MNEPDEYQHWLETGEYPDGSKSVKFVLTVKEIDGILEHGLSISAVGSTTTSLPSTQSESDTPLMQP